MARSPKFPGIQFRFEEALRSRWPVGQVRLSTRQIGELFGLDSETEFTPAEVEYIKNNVSWMLSGAKSTGAVDCPGKKQGYTLRAPTADSAENGSSKAKSQPVVSNANADQQETGKQVGYQQWESALHFVATITLGKLWEAHVASLPKTSGAQQWENPDMVYTRAPGWRNHAEESLAGMLKRADTTPDVLVGSIELKWFKSATFSRMQLMQAIAETAGNSLWANEAWLAFMGPSSCGDQSAYRLSEDPEPLALARSMGIGVIEFMLSEDGAGKAKQFEGAVGAKVLVEALTRTTLQLQKETLNTKRKLLETVAKTIEQFENGESWSDGDTDEAKAHRLLIKAHDNLRLQSGFAAAPGGELEPALRPYAGSPVQTAIAYATRDVLEWGDAKRFFSYVKKTATGAEWDASKPWLEALFGFAGLPGASTKIGLSHGHH